MHPAPTIPAQAVETARKLKRDREARIRRLMETLDDDDLAALEAERRIGDDGERVSLEDIMREQPTPVRRRSG